MGKRGMQSDEAMGVSAFALLEEQLGHKKVENFKMPGYIEKEKAEKKPAPPSTPQRRAPRPQPVSAKHADLLAQGYTEAQIEDMKRLTDQTSNALNQRYSNMRAAFHYVDVDNNGVVSQKEIERALKMWNISLEPGKVEMIMKQCDRDGDGSISYDEFVDALARDTVAPAAMGKRGMQSDEAMGVSAYALLEEQLGHKKVDNFKMPGYKA